MRSQETFVVRVVSGPDHGRQAVVLGSVLIGRNPVDLQLTAPQVSREHCRVTAVGGQIQLTDLGSKRGTSVEGRRLEGSRVLRPGERFQVGPDTLLLLTTSAPAHRVGVDRLRDVELRVHEPGYPVRGYSLARVTRIGRDRARCDLVIEDDALVSNAHCMIEVTDDQLVLTSLSSSRPTYVDGRTVALPHPLAVGERIMIGRTEIHVATGPDGSAAGPSSSIDLVVREESGRRPWAATVTSRPGAVVSEVVAALTGYLGLPDSPYRFGEPAAPGVNWCLYREDDARLLSQQMRWEHSGVARGDRLVIAPLAPGSDPLPPAAGSMRSGGAQVPRQQRIAFTGFPSARPHPEPHRIEPPTIPEPLSWRGRGVGWQIAGGLGMVATGIGMAFINPAFLIFAALGGVASIWSIFAGLFGERARHRTAVSNFRERLVSLDAELAQARIEHVTALHDAYPAVEQVTSWPLLRDRSLWRGRQGDPNFLSLRLGVGRRPMPISIDAYALRSTSPLVADVTAVLDRHGVVEDAPVTIGGAGGVVGVTGDAVTATAVARSLVVQATGIYPPRTLPVAVLNTNADEDWTRWLPHVEDTAGVRASYTAAACEALADRLASALSTGDKPARSSPRMLLMVDGDAAQLQSVRSLLSRAAEGHALAVVCAPGGDPPPETTTLVECHPYTSRLVMTAATAATFRPEGTTRQQAHEFAQALGQFSDGSTDSAAQHGGAVGAGLVDLLGIADPDTADAVSLWSRPPPVPMGAPLGVLDSGQVLEMSLLDGPHGLVAGTTGSGKSELLQSLLVGMAATHPPETLAFFLVDFKGGATFTEIARLPHVVGVVTNLDGALAQRAVTSLAAELTRRQSVLAAAATKEFPDYRPDPARGLEPLPRLLLVIDEFAMLASQLPDVMDRFVEIATVGRSLGVHMLLATQSPSGVVSGKVDANTNIRICLRVALEQESRDVLGRTDAAQIPVDRPGRGFLRIGGGNEVLGFQVARIAEPLRGTGASRVRVAPFGDNRPTVAKAAQREDARGPTALHVLTERLAETARARDVPAARQLWLPPLPTRLPLDALSELPAATGRGVRFRLGLCDVPEEVAQPVFELDLTTEGHVLVVGAYGSGKTTTLRQIAAELATTHRPDQVHLYGIDVGDGSLEPLSVLPHVGDIVPANDLERLTRLLSRLDALVAARRGAGLRAIESLPATVLLMDDFAAFREASDRHQYGVLLDRLVSLIRSGPAVRLHVVATAQQRSDMPSALFTMLGRKVFLRQSDPLDYDAVGIPSRGRPSAPPPGRAFVAGDPPREVQIPWSEAGRHEAVARRWQAVEPTIADLPRPVPRFPTAVALADVLSGHAFSGTTVFGVGDPDLEPAGFHFRRDGPHLVVTGDERSGRSTALTTLARSLLQSEPEVALVAIAPRQSPLHALAEVAGVTVCSAAADMAAALTQLPEQSASTVLLMDDAESLPDSVGPALEPLLRGARDSGLRTVVAMRGSDLARSFDPWVRFLRSQRALLLLMPRPEHAELVGVRLPPQVGERVPGRGLLYSGGEPITVQVATTEIAVIGSGLS